MPYVKLAVDADRHNHGRNITRRVVKSPKLYFGDTGLAAYLLRYPDSATLRHGPQGGAIFENLVLLECLKRKSNLNRNADFFFYRDSSHNEIDLVVDTGDALDLVEIKATSTSRASDFDALKRLLPLFPDSRSWVANLAPESAPLAGRLATLPWQALAATVAR